MLQVNNIQLRELEEYQDVSEEIEKPHFRRNRRSFEIISSIVIFYNLLGAQIGSISPLGISTTDLERQELLLPIVIIMYLYFYFRYKLASIRVKNAFRNLIRSIKRDYLIAIVNAENINRIQFSSTNSRFNELGLFKWRVEEEGNIFNAKCIHVIKTRYKVFSSLYASFS